MQPINPPASAAQAPIVDIFWIIPLPFMFETPCCFAYQYILQRLIHITLNTLLVASLRIVVEDSNDHLYTEKRYLYKGV
jgi:hypothetical protein